MSAAAAVRWTIRQIGNKGDGIAGDEAGNTAFIPFTLPGETVSAAVTNGRGESIAILQPSSERVEPPCPHFGDCGGCALQHWERRAYSTWKREKLVDALKSRGIDIEVAPLIDCPEQARRRVTFGVRRTEAGLLLGFHAALSNRIVPIETCIIADPAIVASLPALRLLGEAVATGTAPFSMTVTTTETGLDVALSGLSAPDEKVRHAVVALALELRFARVSWNGEILVEPVKPDIVFGTAKVTPPPGAFLQAVPSAEEAMASLVVEHVKGAKMVADLFAGCGTFALRMARKANVHAVEGEAAPLAALQSGFRFGEKLRQVTVEKRDLFDRPLTWKELKSFDAVVFDPPRAGAEDQCRQLAKSDVPRLAAVSCNPVTLARDLSILLDGGYTLKSITPIDQFLWSPHLEVLALLEKPGKSRRRR
ncbi:class I SAM-dependent RNA methyltransferase [Notoacmeibacter ruber]|uniref:Class I SAM-dependent RNA methyltransferase n=1 Tax=Notoacmeibacter ruber TaxID=2670375 RepID=A0A3L7J9M5_9HYPH|nr:class I SAM-dependent RNA methyltransferase [Notoacmeibacter ruber]RLQ87447.1 class I SAM-dependent RNA methyltransferase [Notoacmeibacter ruber]